MKSTRVPPNVKVQPAQEGKLAPTSPTVARWELALRLKNRREELGISVKTITDHLGFTRNYWSQVENERAVLADDKFETALDMFDFDAEERKDLHALRDASRKRGWWAEYTGLDDDVKRLLGLEYGATEIRGFSHLIVPGLLQTEEYTRALLGADPMFSELQIGQTADIRRRRQRRLTSDQPLQFTALISEAALRQEVGGAQVHQRQLEHLAWVLDGGLETVEIQVLPFASSPGPLLLSSSLVFLDFPSTHLPTVAWEESIRVIGPIDDEEQSDRLARCYHYAVTDCLRGSDVRTLIDQLLGQ